jgi:hypothetical protein
MSHRTRATALHVTSFVLVASLGCDGYLALPLRERAFAPMAFSGPHAERLPQGGRSSRVEVRLDPIPALMSRPGEVAPAPGWVVVGAPSVASAGAAVAGWAFGRCDDAAAAGAEPLPLTPGPQHLCLAVRWDATAGAVEPLVVTVIAEARATGQRVTFIADALSQADAEAGATR